MPGFEAGPEPGSRWTLVFDGASNARGHGISVIITSPTGFHLPFTARLCFDCTNNMAEYEACIYSLEATIDLRIKILEVYSDSALVISQVKGDWETQDSKLIPYKEHIRKLVPYFDVISFHHISREENKLADALAMLASMFKVKWKNDAPSIHIDHLDELAHCLAIEANPDDKPWFYDIKTFMEKQQYPEGITITDKMALRRLSSKFFLNGYINSVCTSTRATPYSLVYGMEVVLPIEVEIPSLRVIMEADLNEVEWVQPRYDYLNLIEEKRLTAVCHGPLYQRRLK
ncbi:uncharacterized protein LOC127122693 [Lathyrus oleraceus]|uniref:uncharacterized protein LOC127122693 n=1 Tax=Pisum sativum TaxID=3888 RepID=UPI0021D3E271|nr:uncharacterized protein LOC127122693 [Pisum sativum]